MKEVGFDISNNKTKDVFDFIKQGKIFNYVITVCDEASAERCPVFVGVTQRLHWSFRDPSSFIGTQAEVVTLTREVRDEIREKIAEWVETVSVP
jgi:arsenate reductase